MNILKKFSEKFKLAIKQRDYFSLAECLSIFVVGYVLFHAIYGSIDLASLIPPSTLYIDDLKSEWLVILEMMLNIAVFGMIPIFFFVKHSLKLSSEQRKERKLSLFMPKYIFFIYGFCLFLFIFLIIIPRI